MYIEGLLLNERLLGGLLDYEYSSKVLPRFHREINDKCWPAGLNRHS